MAVFQEITRPSDCGKVYSCFHDGCKGGNCDFMLTWKETGDDILFSLACKRPQNAYCAIGLSKDENMVGVFFGVFHSPKNTQCYVKMFFS
ncbi:hypothetical protein DPMN_033951 [Dreissena polymorpha]|uniref:DOMON domain-containing protein n=1 Tax=Dreissena polymorpha TaxID=45954 RepID=A0A9D4M998_DREPO|nr:hypothetical protein DPMN_033951 [Dreissena polymorpha]